MNLKRYLLLTLASCSFLLIPLSAQAELNNLQPLEWKNRILLIKDVPDQKAWIKRLQAHKAAVDERHIVWFVLSQPVQTNYVAGVSASFARNILQRYAFGSAKVLLVGKDGEVKERLDDLDLTFFYQQIDQMPMRRMEMRQQSQFRQ